MKTILKVFAGFVVLGLILQAFKDEPKRSSSSAETGVVNNDPECILVRQKMAASQNGMGLSADDLILATRCNQ